MCLISISIIINYNTILPDIYFYVQQIADSYTK